MQNRALALIFIMVMFLFVVTGCQSSGETALPEVTIPRTGQTEEPASATPPTSSPESGATTAVDSPTQPSASSLDDLQIALEQVVTGLNDPVGLYNAGDGSGRIFVLEKAGQVRVIEGGELLARPFLDIRLKASSGAYERGLLGLAFPPEYVMTGVFYAYYTDINGNTVVARYRGIPGADTADASSEEVLLRIQQPASNHNGGHIAFGPDRYLYIGLGDGGAANDKFGNGQNTETLLGAILRIDVNQDPYTIPPDNPFAGNTVNVREEIWAYGLRNPWKFSFDRLTGDLYIADVGQNSIEEVNFQPAGSAGGHNYGWPIMEGSSCFAGSCNPAEFSPPVTEYTHSDGCSVTGGYVYRGAAQPNLNGIYFFGDFCTGRIWGMAQTTGGEWENRELLKADIGISAFGEDEDGELYVVDMNNGVIYRVISQ